MMANPVGHLYSGEGRRVRGRMRSLRHGPDSAIHTLELPCSPDSG